MPFMRVRGSDSHGPTLIADIQIVDKVIYCVEYLNEYLSKLLHIKNSVDNA